jgi:hypothetical protein
MRRFGEELADLETGLQADRIYAGEQKVQREDLKSEREPDLDGGMKRLGHNGISPHRPYRSQ